MQKKKPRGVRKFKLSNEQAALMVIVRALKRIEWNHRRAVLRAALILTRDDDLERALRQS